MFREEPVSMLRYVQIILSYCLVMLWKSFLQQIM